MHVRASVSSERRPSTRNSLQYGLQSQVRVRGQRQKASPHRHTLSAGRGETHSPACMVSRRKLTHPPSKAQPDPRHKSCSQTLTHQQCGAVMVASVENPCPQDSPESCSGDLPPSCREVGDRPMPMSASHVCVCVCLPKGMGSECGLGLRAQDSMIVESDSNPPAHACSVLVSTYDMRAVALDFQFSANTPPGAQSCSPLRQRNRSHKSWPAPGLPHPAAMHRSLGTKHPLTPAENPQVESDNPTHLYINSARPDWSRFRGGCSILSRHSNAESRG